MSDVEKPEFLELDITGVAHGGVFIARHEGRVVFVADAIPGERVLARVSTEKSSFLRAETVSVLSASPHRREHIWSASRLERDPAQRAGGAEFGHIDLAFQRSLKENVLSEALERFGKMSFPVTVEAAPGDEASNGLRWRTRVSLQADTSGLVGPYAARSHTVIPVDDLPLATLAMEQAAPLGQYVSGSTGLDLVQLSDGSVRLSDRPAPRRRGSKPAPDNSPTITETVGDREFQLAENGFWQVHREAPAVLTAAVQEAIIPEFFDPSAANLDLYGGVGLLAAAVGERFGRGTRITSVESAARATDHAAANLSDWIGAQAVTGRVDRYLAELLTSASAAERARLRAATIVLDPPRSGAGREVVSQIVELSPEQVVYVACDPVALARDLGEFAANGYELRSLRGFDLFPHTHHVEAVATLVRSTR